MGRGYVRNENGNFDFHNVHFSTIINKWVGNNDGVFILRDGVFEQAKDEGRVRLQTKAYEWEEDEYEINNVEEQDVIDPWDL